MIGVTMEASVMGIDSKVMRLKHYCFMSSRFDYEVTQDLFVSYPTQSLIFLFLVSTKSADV